MVESKQMIIKENVIECMKDGKERTVREIKNYLEQCGVTIEKDSTALRNALFNLKQENPSLINIRRGVYVWREDKTSKSEIKNRTLKYDLSDFITVSNSTKKENDLVVSIFQDGTFALNKSLLQFFPERKAEVKLKKDCSQLAIIKNGNDRMDLGKNGRIKNYDTLKMLKAHKKKFPIYYVGNWDGEYGIWIGKISSDNPNKKRGK